MNIKRAIGYSLFVYITSSILFAFAAVVFGVSLEAPSLAAYMVYWIGTIVILLLFAKWYFRVVSPSVKQGLYLGLVTLGVSVLIDLLSIGGTIAMGESTDMFVQMYTSWQFYFTILIVLATTTYAGYEFDGTYTGGPMSEKMDK